MTSDDLQNALEQNRENLKALLDAVDSDYELPEDPETEAKMAAIFGGKTDVEKAKEAADMSDAERAAWLFEENAKALAAAADAAGARSVKSPDVGESDALDALAKDLGGDR